MFRQRLQGKLQNITSIKLHVLKWHKTFSKIFAQVREYVVETNIGTCVSCGDFYSGIELVNNKDVDVSINVVEKKTERVRIKKKQTYDFELTRLDGVGI